MEGRGRPSDAMIAAVRCWKAMQTTDDEMTRTALWKAAVKYAVKARRDAMLAGVSIPENFGASVAGGEPRPLLAHGELGSFVRETV